jgi:hypothetical protein
MTTRQNVPDDGARGDPPLRASDAERDAGARRIQVATAEGRLTLQEAGERLDAVFASRFRHELSSLVSDLPVPGADAQVPGADAQVPGAGAGGRAWWASRALAAHAALVLVLSVLLVVRWASGASPGPPAGSGAGPAGSGLPYFWPMFPMFWLYLSLGAHALWRWRRA